jgi:hypothetical protein
MSTNLELYGWPTISHIFQYGEHKMFRSISHSSVCQLAPKLGQIYHMHEWRSCLGGGGGEEGWMVMYN